MKHATSEVAAGKGYDSIYVPSCGSGDSVSQHGHPSTTFMDTYVIFNLDCALPKYVVEYVFDPEEASRSLRQAEYEKNPYVERYNRITMEDTGHVSVYEIVVDCLFGMNTKCNYSLDRYYVVFQMMKHL